MLECVEVQRSCTNLNPVLSQMRPKGLLNNRTNRHFPALNSSLSHFPLPALLTEAQIEKKSGSGDSRSSVSHHSDPLLVPQPFKTIESLRRETADVWMFLPVKELLCSGKQPGPAPASQRVSTGHCFLLPMSIFFLHFGILCFHSSCSCGL